MPANTFWQGYLIHRAQLVWSVSWKESLQLYDWEWDGWKGSLRSGLPWAKSRTQVGKGWHQTLTSCRILLISERSFCPSAAMKSRGHTVWSPAWIQLALQAHVCTSENPSEGRMALMESMRSLANTGSAHNEVLQMDSFPETEFHAWCLLIVWDLLSLDWLCQLNQASKGITASTKHLKSTKYMTCACSRKPRRDLDSGCCILAGRLRLTSGFHVIQIDLSRCGIAMLNAVG